jgi:hypothetical protein
MLIIPKIRKILKIGEFRTCLFGKEFLLPLCHQICSVKAVDGVGEVLLVLQECLCRLPGGEGHQAGAEEGGRVVRLLLLLQLSKVTN